MRFHGVGRFAIRRPFCIDASEIAQHQPLRNAGLGGAQCDGRIGVRTELPKQRIEAGERLFQHPHRPLGPSFDQPGTRTPPVQRVAWRIAQHFEQGVAGRHLGLCVGRQVDATEQRAGHHVPQCGIGALAVFGDGLFVDLERLRVERLLAQDVRLQSHRATAVDVHRAVRALARRVPGGIDQAVAGGKRQTPLAAVVQQIGMAKGRCRQRLAAPSIRLADVALQHRLDHRLRFIEAPGTDQHRALVVSCKDGQRAQFRLCGIGQSLRHVVAGFQRGRQIVELAQQARAQQGRARRDDARTHQRFGGESVGQFAAITNHVDLGERAAGVGTRDVVFERGSGDPFAHLGGTRVAELMAHGGIGGEFGLAVVQRAKGEPLRGECFRDPAGALPAHIGSAVRHQGIAGFDDFHMAAQHHERLRLVQPGGAKMFFQTRIVDRPEALQNGFGFFEPLPCR